MAHVRRRRDTQAVTYYDANETPTAPKHRHDTQDCPMCQGSGIIAGPDGLEADCPLCWAEGQVTDAQLAAYDEYTASLEERDAAYFDAQADRRG